MRPRHCPSLAILLALSASAAFGAGGPPKYGSITGVVKDADTGAPLNFANVVLLQTTMGAIVHREHFRIDPVPIGTYRIRATFIGYNPASVEIVVEEGKTTSVEFALRKPFWRGGVQAIRTVRPFPRGCCGGIQYAIPLQLSFPIPLKLVEDPLRGRGINLVPGQGDDDIPAGKHDRHLVREDCSYLSQGGLDLDLLLEHQRDPDLIRLVQAIRGRTF